jgi:DnaD/phage-associated family protein
MKKFTGFTENETFARMPDSFFQQLLPGIADLDELKVTLVALWRFEHMENPIRFLRMLDFRSIIAEPGPALEKAVRSGSLLRVQDEAEELYFLNSPRGRAAADAFTRGQWKVSQDAVPSHPPGEHANIFKLYEENIGPLTPMLADALKDAEQTYATEWVAEALEIAVKNNKRSWKYVEAILHRWKEEGHAKKQDGRDAKELRGRDVTRKVEDFLKR